MQYNTVLNKDNFGDLTRRKHWEVQMALATLKNFKAAQRSKVVLGVGAGCDPTIYHLTTKCAQVVATDLYGEGGTWMQFAPGDMLTDSWKYAPVDVKVDPERLLVQYADMRTLPFEDASFDGVFCGSIHRIGSFDDVAVAASEIGRVLKVGGIATICTEFKAWGGGFGWPGVLLFDRDRLYEYLIEASGLAPVDEPYLTVHEDTLNQPPAVSLEKVVSGLKPDVEMALRSETHNYVFTSVHLALRKERG